MTRARPAKHASCRHYYDVDAHNVGVCRLCGTRKDFGAMLDQHFAMRANAVRSGVNSRKQGRPRKFT